MHYRPKEAIITGLLGDADAVMREFYRAVNVANHLDQNNVEDSTVSTGDAVPFTSRRSLASVRDIGTGVDQVKTQTTPHTTVNDDRIFYDVTDGVGVDFSIAFTTLTTMPFVFGLSGGYQVTALSTYPTIDIRFLLDGSPVGLFSNSQARGAGTVNIWIGLRESIIVAPGIHSLKVQVRDRSDTAGIGVISGLKMYAFGYAR